jgi:prolyl oligopeptidase
MKATGLTLSSSVLLFIFSLSASGQAVNNGFGPYPSAPKAEPLTETVHGITISDPYRWMESPAHHDEMVAWVKASSAQTTDTLARLPARAALLKALEDASRSSTVYSSVRSAGGRIFFLERAPDHDIAVLKVRENGQDRLLLDPMAGASAGTHRTINNSSISPDGKLVAVHMAEGGGEVGSIRIYDVATGKPLEDVLTPIWGEFSANWIDDKTLTYTRMKNASGGEEAMENMTVFLHRLGTPTSSDTPVLGSKVGAGFPMKPVEFPLIQIRPTSRYAIALAGGARADVRLGVTTVAALTSGKPEWVPLADYDDKINDFDLKGDTLYYLTTAHDPNGEIRSVDLRQGKLSASRSVPVPKGIVVNGISTTTQGLYISAMNPDASSRLLFVPKDAEQTVDVPIPVIGSVSNVAETPDQSYLTLAVDSIQQNTTYYRFDGSKLIPLGIFCSTLPAASSMRVVQEMATSADGTLRSADDRRAQGPRQATADHT